MLLGNNISQVSWKIFVVFATALTQLQALVNGQNCSTTDIRNIKIVNITQKINFHLPDHRNLSHQYLNITYAWDIQVPDEKPMFDGILYCYHDLEKVSFENLYESQGGYSLPEIDYPASEESGDYEDLHNDPFFGSLPSGKAKRNKNTTSLQSTYSKCKKFIGSTYYVTYKNGTNGNCKYPCVDEIDQSCVGPFPTACTEIGNGCRPLPKDQRNITLHVEFGRVYQLQILPYVGQAVSLAGEDAVAKSRRVFCIHHHIETHNLTDFDAIQDWCSESQTIAKHYVATGPPSRLAIHRTRWDFNTNEQTVTIGWRKPYDVVSSINITHYAVFASHSTLDSIEYLSLEKLEATAINSTYFHNVTYVPGNFDNPSQLLEIKVNAMVMRNKTDCVLDICETVGEEGLLRFQLHVFYPCNNNTAEQYCDFGAICSPRNNTKQYLANCVCGQGYVGNGFNPALLSHGTGCRNLNRCVLEPPICSENTVCEDYPPPSEGGSCSCKSAYVGDGYVDGTGCVHIGVIGFVALVALVVLIAAVNGAIYFHRRFKNKMLLTSALSRFVPGNNGNYIANLNNFFFSATEKAEPAFGENYEINRSDITFHEIIGRGNFGVVHRATLLTDDGERTVAVKSLSGVYTSDYKEDFMAEINLLIVLGDHENILNLIGVCSLPTEEDDAAARSPLMISEYMAYGDLLHFLWDSRDSSKRERDPIYDFTELSLYKIGRQVAHGMSFLADARIIHGDVAARNMLVGKNLKIKISDFGLANDVYRYGMIKGATERRVPFKWISPERMTGGVTPITWKSDVWSYGILLFEMVTLGSAPYPSMTPETIFEKLQSGYRIPQPSSCSDYLYAIMKSCWCWESFERPSFRELESKLSNNVEESLVTRIEVADEVNVTNYELDIGRRDVTQENGHAFTNRNANGVDMANEVNEHTTTNGFANDHTHWTPWSGDIPVHPSNEEHQRLNEVV